MVTKCVNSACNEYSYEYRRNGKLFLRDLRQTTPVLRQVGEMADKSTAVRYFWLCKKCSPELTVMVDQRGRPGVIDVRPARAQREPMPLRSEERCA